MARYDRWCDDQGTHILLGARVRQTLVDKAHGALPSRLGKQGVVVGYTLGTGSRLYVRFDGEDGRVSIRPYLLRVVPGGTLDEPPVPGGPAATSGDAQ